MAKSKTASAAQDTSVDDLLNGDAPDTTSTEGQAADQPNAAEVTEKSQEDLDKEALEAQIKEMQAKIKALKAQAKGEKVPSERTRKGQMVTFKNKNGDVITGLGVLYYVARSGGKLHYKEASMVAILPEGWKEGDALPEPPSKPEKVAPAKEETPAA